MDIFTAELTTKNYYDCLILSQLKQFLKKMCLVKPNFFPWVFLLEGPLNRAQRPNYCNVHSTSRDSSKIQLKCL